MTYAMDYDEILQERAALQEELSLRVRIRELREAAQRQRFNQQQNNNGESADFKSDFKSEDPNDDVVFVNEQQAPHRQAAAAAPEAGAVSNNLQHMQALPFPSPYTPQESRESQAMPGDTPASQLAFPTTNVPQPNLQQGGFQPGSQATAAAMPPPPTPTQRRGPSTTPETEKKLKKIKLDFRPPHDCLPSIVRSPEGNGYVELRCCFCGGNHSTKHRAGAFFKGAAGLANHIRICHMSKWAQKFGTKELSNLEVVQQCRYKDIESYMVDQMVRGNKKAYKIQQVDADGNAEAGTMVTRPRTARAGKRKAKGEAKAAADKESQEMAEAAEALMSLRKKPRHSTNLGASSSPQFDLPASSPLAKQSQLSVEQQEAKMQDGIHANGGLYTPQPESAQECGEDEDEDDEEDMKVDEPTHEEPIFEWPGRKNTAAPKIQKASNSPWKAARKSAPGGPSARW